MEIENRIRGLIISDGKLLVVKHKPTDDYYALPGGHLEAGETLEEGMAREILEETGFRAEVGNLAAVHQLIIPSTHSIEFFFHIKNGQDFFNMDLTKGSHCHEICDHKFIDPTDVSIKILPLFVCELAKEIIEAGTENILVKVVRGGLE